MRWVLKKISAASLVETIIATIIITMVFTIAIVGITDLLEAKVRNNYHVIDSKLHQLSYAYDHGKVVIPTIYEEGNWTIKTEKIKEGELTFVVFRATHKETKNVRIQKLLE